MTPPKKAANKKPTSYTVVGHPPPSAVPQHIWDLLQTAGVGTTLHTKLTTKELDDLEAQGIIAKEGEGR